MIRRKRNPFLNQITYNSKIVIGMVGEDSGVGTTHTSLLVANYFNNWIGAKTCYIEFGTQNQISSMVKENELVCSKDSYSVIHPNYFLYQDIICYPSLRENQLPYILSAGYQCIVIDFGTKANVYRNEILRCDKRFLITSLKPWKRRKSIQSFINGRWKNLRIEDIIVPFGSKNEMSQMYQAIDDIQVYSVPYEPDPFVIKEESLKVLNQIFQ